MRTLDLISIQDEATPEPDLVLEEYSIKEPNLLTPGKKPIGPVKIDWSHPLTEGLNWCQLIGENIELVSGKPVGTLENGATVDAIDGQQGVAFDGTNDYINLGDQAVLEPSATGGQYTWAFQFYLSAASPANEILMAKSSTTSGNRVVRIMPYYSSKPGNTQFLTGDSAGNWYDSYVASNPPAQQITSGVFVLDYSNSKKYAYYPNSSNSTSTEARQTKDTVSNWQLGMEATSTFPLQGAIYLFCTWGRSLSAKEAADFNTDPYQFLIPA